MLHVLMHKKGEYYKSIVTMADIFSVPIVRWFTSSKRH